MDRHERDQIEVLMPLLERAFKGDEEGCTVLVNVKLPIAQPNQFDLIAIRRNSLVAIDLKDFRGRILADCAPDGKWVVESNGKNSWKADRENPFSQADRHRRQLSNFLVTQVLGQETLESLPKENKGHLTSPFYWVASNIRSWVVVQPGSKVIPINLDPGKSPWFRITALDVVPRELLMELASRALLSHEDIVRMAARLGAQYQPNWKEWYLSPSHESPAGDIERLKFAPTTASFQSNDLREVLQGIHEVTRLGLRAYLPELVALSNSTHSCLAIESLRALEEWGSKVPSTREIEWLTSEDPQRRAWAWMHVEATKNPAAAAILEHIIASGESGARHDALRLLLALELSETPGFLLETSRGWLRDEEPPDEETWALIVSGLGVKGFTRAISFLKQLLKDRLERVAQNWHAGSAGIIESAIQAFAEIGEPSVVGDLAPILRTQEGEFDGVVIRALGRLGNKSSVPRIVPYLESPSEDLIDASREALRRIGGPAAFDALWSRFMKEVRAGNRMYKFTEALGQIDREEFERRILALLGEGKESTDAIGSLLWSLGRFATARSAPIVLRYTTNRDTYIDACNVLLMPDVFPAVENLTKAMHDAPNEVERAAHVYLSVPTGSSMELQDLEPHEKDASAVVRMCVVQVYAAFRSEYTASRLDTMANDPDPLLQRSVALALLGHAEHWMHFCDVAAGSRAMLHAEAIYRPVGIIAVQQGKEDTADPSPILIEKEAITEVRQVNFPAIGPVVGVTYRSDGEERRMVIVPRDTIPYLKEEEVKDWILGLTTQGYAEVINLVPLDPPSPAFVAIARSLFSAQGQTGET